MNYLAHSFLSFNNEKLLIGNFIADAIKGNSYKSYDIEIQKGILLHRKIDEFTDKHTIVNRSINRLNGEFNKYGSVVIDMYYDHFLSKFWNKYSNTNLNLYTQNIYNILNLNFLILPPKIKRILPIMISQNWLYNYQFFDKLDDNFNGMATRTKFKSNFENASSILIKNHSELANDFILFFDDIIYFVNKQIY